MLKSFINKLLRRSCVSLLIQQVDQVWRSWVGNCSLLCPQSWFILTVVALTQMLAAPVPPLQYLYQSKSLALNAIRHIKMKRRLTKTERPVDGTGMDYSREWPDRLQEFVECLQRLETALYPPLHTWVYPHTAQCPNFKLKYFDKWLQTKLFSFGFCSFQFRTCFKKQNKCKLTFLNMAYL